MGRFALFAVPALLISGALLAGCSNTKPSVNRRPQGGSATASVVGGIQQVKVTAGDTYRFDPATITVRPGQIKIILVNTGNGAPHDWSLVGLPGAATADAPGGASRSVTFTAPSPGTYQVVCRIHEKQGQTGKLVVLPD
jgi:plastocyanin